MSRNFNLQPDHLKTNEGRRKKGRTEVLFNQDSPLKVPKVQGNWGNCEIRGTFETFQVEETQPLGSWQSIIRKLESIPKSPVNGLWGTWGRAVPRARRAVPALPLGLVLWPELSQVVFPGSERHEVREVRRSLPFLRLMDIFHRYTSFLF